jgi:signal transduction histidine kinase
MRESLRGRLLLWYTVIVAMIVAGFGGGVLYLAWRARLAGIDAVLHDRAASLARALQPAGEGNFDLALPPAADADDLYHALWDASGQPIDRSDPDLVIPRPSRTGAVTRDGRREVSVTTAGGATVLVGIDLGRARAELWPLAGALAASGAAAIALSLIGGWWLVGRTMRPIARISRTAQAMVDGDFGARVPVDDVATELGQLGRALNEAFDRLHASLVRQRRFTADASHELRTPLATISTEMQWALARPRTADELRTSLEATTRAAGRMQGVVERLLALAREESGEPPDASVTVGLDALVRDTAAELQPLATEHRLAIAIESQPVSVVGDPDRLREALTHLVTNAIRYNVDGGRVEIRLRHSGERAEIAVADTGAGIAAADLGRVFEPFFRTDAARSRDAGGAGLGLAVARAIIRRHGGDVTCESELGRGTTMTVRLPMEHSRQVRSQKSEV